MQTNFTYNICEVKYMSKFVYNDELDSVAVNQCGEYEEANGVSLDEPKYKRFELDSRDLEILIDCLEAGTEAYEPDSDIVGDPDYEGGIDAMNRIAKMIEIFSE